MRALQALLPAHLSGEVMVLVSAFYAVACSGGSRQCCRDPPNYGGPMSDAAQTAIRRRGILMASWLCESVNMKSILVSLLLALGLAGCATPASQFGPRSTRPAPADYAPATDVATP